MQTDKEEGRRLSYKYRIYPDAEQQEKIARNIGCCRWVYNHFLAEREAVYKTTQKVLKEPVIGEDGKPVRENGKVVYEERENPDYDETAKVPSMFDQSRELTALKRQLRGDDGSYFLKDADSTALTYALRHLDTAYKRFYDNVKKGNRGGHPRFKKKSSRGSYTTAGHTTKLDLPADGSKRGRIYLSKVGWVEAVIHRTPEGSLVSCTVERTPTGRFYASVNVKDAPAEGTAPALKQGLTGVSFGISEWAVTSDGTVYDNPRYAEKLLKRLRREQRSFARMKKGGSNWEKQRKRIARLHERIAACRKDATHNLTRKLVNEHEALALRENRVQDMQRKKTPWKLNGKLADANLYELYRQIQYKADWANKLIVVVPSDYPTAQVCSFCGHKEESLADDLRQLWRCPVCGCENDRKLNGALNIKAAAEDILAGTKASAVTREALKTRARKKSDAAK